MEEEKKDVEEGEVEHQRFALAIVKTVNKKTKKANIQLKSKSEGIPLAEAVIYVDGWAKKVKQKLQEPVTKTLKFWEEES